MSNIGVYMWGSRLRWNMPRFNITIRAQSCYNGIILCHFSSAVGEHHSNKRRAHSQRNKVTIESIEVEIFRVIYGSFWIISICASSAFSAHFMHVFSLPFFSSVLNFSVITATNWLGERDDSYYLWGPVDDKMLAWKKLHISSLCVIRRYSWSWTTLPKVNDSRTD